jgi:regulator of ribonuclease activity A
LASHPRRSFKKGHGERDIDVHFADVTFSPGHYVYADEDGIIVSAKPLQG